MAEYGAPELTTPVAKVRADPYEDDQAETQACSVQTGHFGDGSWGPRAAAEQKGQEGAKEFGSQRERVSLTDRAG